MMHTNKMCFYRRGEKGCNSPALGKGFVFVFWSQKLRKWEYANTMKYKLVPAVCGFFMFYDSCKANLGK